MSVGRGSNGAPVQQPGTLSVPSRPHAAWVADFPSIQFSPGDGSAIACTKEGERSRLMRSTIRSVLVTACIFLAAAALSAQATVSLGGAGTLTLKGFISATAFAQNQNTTFGNGQNAEFPAGAQCEVDCWFGGGDIRNTRLTLAFDGPKLFGDWKGGGVVEMDFFGGFANPTNSAFEGEQPVPRLRLGLPAAHQRIDDDPARTELGASVRQHRRLALPHRLPARLRLGRRHRLALRRPLRDPEADGQGLRGAGRHLDRHHVRLLERPGL